tara:strand:- start:13459 stop:15606 length:2148 start_codon:yes stop_codon:yes gene_type:complete
MTEILLEYVDSANIAEDLDADKLAEIGSLVHRGYTIDEDSRAEWKAKMDKAMKMALQVQEAKNTPWPNASNVKYPLMTTAAIQFAARAYPAMVPGVGVVKGKVIGSDRQPAEQGPPGAPMGEPMDRQDTKRDRAKRIGGHMSWQLIEQMEEWEEETDRLLHVVPVLGLAYRKTYYDPMRGHNVSELVLPDKLIVNDGAKSLETTPRITQELRFYPHEIVERVRSGVWREEDLGLPQGEGDDEDAPHVFLEQHRYLDLDDDGYPEPYIVTFHRDTKKVMRIFARFEAEGVHMNEKGQIAKIDPIHYYTKYPFIPSPDGAWHDIGFGVLLGPLGDSVDTILNQMIDAATLQNMGGGFIGSGLRVKGGKIRQKLGEWTVVQTPGDGIARNVVPVNHPGPSPVLFQLLGLLIDACREIASIKDVLTGETQANIPATTTLAMIEQGMKVFTAIYKRLHRALKKELKKLYRLNGLYLNEQEYYTVLDEERAVAREDYAAQDMDVVPVSDPAVVTDMQKMARAQFLMDFINDSMFNQLEIRRRLLDAASIEDPANLIVEQQPDPADDPTIALEISKQELEQAKIEIQSKETEARISKMMAEAEKLSAETDKINMGEDPEGEVNRLEVEKERLQDQKGIDILKLENERQLAEAKLRLDEQIAAREAELKEREMEVKAEIEREKIKQSAKTAEATLKQQTADASFRAQNEATKAQAPQNKTRRF